MSNGFLPAGNAVRVAAHGDTSRAAALARPRRFAEGSTSSPMLSPMVSVTTTCVLWMDGVMSREPSSLTMFPRSVI